MLPLDTWGSNRFEEQSIDQATELYTRCITSVKDFDDLRLLWDKLLNSTKEPHPFISWEWLYTWWETFSDTKDELLIVTVSDKDTIIGIAPFYIKHSLLGNALMFIGEGEAADELVATHYLDIICAEKNREIVTSSVGDFLRRNKKEWSFCKFSFLLETSSLFKILSSLQRPLTITVSLGHQFKINFANDFDDFYTRLSKSTRRQFRSKRNRMQKVAPLELLSLDLSDSIESSLETLEKLHEHRQHEKGEASAFASPRFKQFHLSLLKRYKGTDKAQIRALKHNGKIVACVLNYLSTGTKNPCVYSYSSGFKSSDDKRFSPMFVFDILDFEESMNKGYKSYDLLSACGESSYKDRYQSETQPVSRVFSFSSTPLGIIWFLSVKARRFGSYLKTKIGVS